MLRTHIEASKAEVREITIHKLLAGVNYLDRPR